MTKAKKLVTNRAGDRRSDCAVACTLDLIGDKWTLLIVRDLFFGKTRYKEFQDSAERIPTNILASRLAKLVALGFVSKTAYQNRPLRYEYRLTDQGESLAPILKAIVKWGAEHIDGVQVPK